MSSVYHPQSDGQTERVNQCLETFLRCFVSACPKKWVSWIALAEYWYNTCYHTAISRSPFEAMYGRLSKHFGIASQESVSRAGMADWLMERKVMTSLIRQHLGCATARMKTQADKGRSKRVFQVGDMVFLKLQPYVQLSLAPQANQKLAFKFFGPFKVV
jgi:hypothetical protein